MVKDNQAGDSGENQDSYALSNYALRYDLTKQPVSRDNSGSEQTNALSSKTVACAFCGKPFERRTTWHKYCEETCKIKAYEIRTGKQWHGKKSATAGG